MLWFFARGSESVRIETRFDNASQEYVLEISSATDPVQTERFLDPAAFQARLEMVEEQLRRDSWTQVGQPEILPHGWRGPFTN